MKEEQNNAKKKPNSIIKIVVVIIGILFIITGFGDYVFSKSYYIFELIIGLLLLFYPILSDWVKKNTGTSLIELLLNAPKIKHCPNCNTKLLPIRMPKNTRQALWGGWSCPNCNAELNSQGKLIEKNSDKEKTEIPYRLTLKHKK